MGEHTDYNEGFVLPVAIDRYCVIAFDANEEDTLCGVSTAENDEKRQPIASLSPGSTASWFDYAGGVLWVHRESGLDVRGMDFVVSGDLPIGAGLSSSAAFELALSRAVVELARGAWDGAREARLARRAENEYVGFVCGIMDQMAVSLSQAGSAMLLDCRSLTFERIPVPSDVLVVVMDTGTRRALVEGAYGERRKSCADAAAALAVSALRDATREAIGRAHLDDLLRRRALHVVEENERTLALAAALRAGDLSRAGTLMAESHESLRDLFEISSPALDEMVAIAREHPEVVGARMTGGGFAGCAVALVRSSGSDAFVEEVERSYRKSTGHPGRLYTCRAVDGAHIV
jgi:galactokinase